MKKSPINVADFLPLGTKVLVEPDFAKDKSSQIVLPDTVERPKLSPFGTVIAVGPDCRLPNGEWYEAQVQPGDRICVSSWQAQPIEVQGKPMVIIESAYLCGIIKDA